MLFIPIIKLPAVVTSGLPYASFRRTVPMVELGSAAGSKDIEPVTPTSPDTTCMSGYAPVTATVPETACTSGYAPVTATVPETACVAGKLFF